MAATERALASIDAGDQALPLSQPFIEKGGEQGEFPAPPYPMETKAGGFKFELNIERMHQSDTWAIAEAHLRGFLVMVWIVSWTQLPAGSLPQSDAVIAARIGMPLSAFIANKSVLMRGWWQANDGRLYHPVLTELVLEMIERKARKANNQANYRNRQRQQGSVSQCDASGSQMRGADVTGHSTVTDTYMTDHQAAADCTTTTTTTTTSIQKQEQMSEPEGSAYPRTKEEGLKTGSQTAPRTLIAIPLSDGSEYSVSGAEIAELSSAYPNKDVVTELRQARAWCLSNPTKQKTRRGVKRFLNGWLARNFPPAYPATSDYFAPAADKFKNIEGGLL